MTQLIPCPGCNRHVRQAETSCPFCSAALALGHLPPAPLPRTRLGRAATFAFGATLAGATALVGCSGEFTEGKKEGEGGAGAGGTTAKAGAGGSSAGTQASGGSGVVGPVYGAPAAGTGSDGGNGNGAGASSAGSTFAGGSAVPTYGAPAAGFAGIPLYGAAPAD